MSTMLVFLSEGKLNVLRDSGTTELGSQIAEKYKQTEKEISLKNEWKTTGTGAKFMGVGGFPGLDQTFSERIPITGVAQCAGSGSDVRLVYSLNFETVGGLYIKDASNPDEPETRILAKSKTKFYELDINPKDRIIVSVADNYLERHLAVLDVTDSSFNTITEGECCDSNPKWSRKNPHIVYYDSCGLGYDGHGNFMGFGPKSIYRLNVATGDLDEVMADDKFDFYCPYEDSDGNLYCIKRPYITSRGLTLNELTTAPFKVLKALGGWLNFFTQRYSGESLKTSGGNPAQSKQKSPEQIFIDGNMIEAEKNLKQNAAGGEKNPGYAPAGWELIMRTPAGEEKILKKGVISYCVSAEGKIFYSNGKYILGADDAAKAHMASKLIYLQQ